MATVFKNNVEHKPVQYFLDQLNAVDKIKKEAEEFYTSGQHHGRKNKLIDSILFQIFNSYHDCFKFSILDIFRS